MENIKFIQDFFYHKENLPDDFYEKIVELENIHFRNKFFKGCVDAVTIEDLASLYKLGVEHFCSKDKEKENYFYEKMQSLLSNDKIIQIIDDNDTIKRSNIISSKKDEPAIYDVYDENSTVKVVNSSSSKKFNIINKNNNLDINNMYNNSKIGTLDNSRINIINGSYNNNQIISYPKFKQVRLSKADKDLIDIKKRKRFSLQFQMIMNKMKFFMQLYDTKEMEKSSNENFNKALEIYDTDIEKQEQSFKLKLQKAKKDKKVYKINQANISRLETSMDASFLESDNNILIGNRSSSINNGCYSQRGSSINIKSEFQNTNVIGINFNNSDTLGFSRNFQLSFLSRRKKSINQIIDSFLKAFINIYYQKHGQTIIKKALKVCEEIYHEKKKSYIKYEEELSVFADLEDGKGHLNKNISESFKLLKQSLEVERNEMIYQEEKLLERVFHEISNKGKDLEILLEEHISELVSSLEEKVMNFFI